jgi:hypothetical protein
MNYNSGNGNQRNYQNNNNNNNDEQNVNFKQTAKASYFQNSRMNIDR